MTYMMGPSVYTDLMTLHVLLNEHRWPLNDTRPNDEECSLEALLVEIVEQFPGMILSEETQALSKRLTVLEKKTVLIMY